MTNDECRDRFDEYFLQKSSGKETSIRWKTSNIQHPTLNIQGKHNLEALGCWMLDVGCWMFPGFMAAVWASTIRHLVPQILRHRFRARTDMQLFINAADIVAHRLDAHAQLVRDLFVGD